MKDESDVKLFYVHKPIIYTQSVLVKANSRKEALDKATARYNMGSILYEKENYEIGFMSDPEPFEAMPESEWGIEYVDPIKDMYEYVDYHQFVKEQDAAV